MSSRKPSSAQNQTAPPEPPAPPGLTVERFTCQGEELAVFSWPVDREPARELPAGLADVLSLLLAGMSKAEIADRRGTSVRTVANQVAALLRTFGVRSRVELARATGRFGP